MRYDPVKGFIAQGVPRTPIGTLDELKAHDLPTKVFHSCSAPTNDGSSLGCPFWGDCDMSYKGLSVEEGGGPRNHCWEHMKGPGQGGNIVRYVAACFVGIPKVDEAHDNEGILRPIADEGEEYEKLTTVPDITSPRDQHGYTKYDTKMVKDVVKPFQRIGQEQKLAQSELRASIMKREKERIKNERIAKTFGAEGSVEPLDKRERRGGGGTKKES